MSRLIIGIDLQEGFLTDEIRQSGYVEKVEAFLRAQNKSDVVLTRFVNAPDSNFVKLIESTGMQAGDPQNELCGSLESAGFEIIEKTAFGAWLPAVQEKAKQAGATEIVMFGLDSDACVLKTSLDVFDAGLRPIVLRDLCENSGGTVRNVQGLALLNVLIGAAQMMQSDAFMPMPPRA